MSNRRSRGEGSIDPQGRDTWRLRYRVDGKRYTTTFRGSLPDARKELRRLLHDGDPVSHALDAADLHNLRRKISIGDQPARCFKPRAGLLHYGDDWTTEVALCDRDRCARRVG